MQTRLITTKGVVTFALAVVALCAPCLAPDDKAIANMLPRTPSQEEFNQRILLGYLGLPLFGIASETTYKELVARRLSSLDIDLDGLDARDLDAAESRAKNYQGDRTPFGAYDLNADGVVTREEVRLAAKLDFNFQDRDGDELADDTWETLDEFITWAEKVFFQIVATGQDKVERAEFERLKTAHLLPLSLLHHFSIIRSAPIEEQFKFAKTDFSGAVSPLTIPTSADIIGSFDTNKDGRLSIEEVISKLDKLPIFPGDSSYLNAEKASCQLPPAPAEAKVIFVSDLRPMAVADVYLGSIDRPTFVSRIEIEPGREPLFLILLGGTSTIWKFEGAVERVAKAVLSVSETSMLPEYAVDVAATGLKPEQVTFQSKKGCLRLFYHRPGVDSLHYTETAKNLLRYRLGRPADVAVGAELGGVISLPSGNWKKPELSVETRQRQAAATISRDEWRKFIASTSGGLVRIDPQEVTASVSVTKIEQLPGFAGIAELVEAGDLEKIEARSASNQPLNYLIVKPVRLPAGLRLADQYTRNFVLKTGLPAPTGPIGSLCILDEKTGKPIEAAKAC